MLAVRCALHIPGGKMYARCRLTDPRVVKAHKEDPEEAQGETATLESWITSW
jgi:hypothetical protein